MTNIVTIDFETFPIEARPDYPPAPVGVAIKQYGEPSRYYAWGHREKNNCTFEEARSAFCDVWYSNAKILCHNAKFDIDVAETHFRVKPKAWNEIEDTLILLFLHDPHQDKLGLKPAAERLLNMPPGERDAVVDWLVEHQPEEAIAWLKAHTGMGKVSPAPKSDAYAGAYVAFAPGYIVGPYACGDVDRTEALYGYLRPRIEARGMQDAYDRERRLLPILLQMERQGVPVGAQRLKADVYKFNDVLLRIDEWLKSCLSTQTLNLDSGSQLVDALIRADKIDTKKLGKTPTGKLKTSKDALENAVTDKTLSAMLRYRAQLNTCMRTFMEPWLETTEKSNGLIFTTWHQVRGTDKNGTRTGRLSSTPNFQNIPKEFAPIWQHEADRKKDEKRRELLPHAPFELPPLPLCRGYIVPFPGEVLIGRDFSSQEIRVLAHYEDDVILQEYKNDPWFDLHSFMQRNLEAILCRPVPRIYAKTGNFLVIYGGGAKNMADKFGIEIEFANNLRNGIFKTCPRLKEMYNEMKIRARQNRPIRTWGGREYYCEPAKIVNDRYMTFDYKLVNVLVQGSSADATKQAIINFEDQRKNAEKYVNDLMGKIVARVTHENQWKILLQVHDEIVISAPREQMHAAMKCLKDAMESLEFDVPMLSEGEWSACNWAEMQDYDVKGSVVCDEI